MGRTVFSKKFLLQEDKLTQLFNIVSSETLSDSTFLWHYLFIAMLIVASLLLILDISILIIKS